ncbi:WW domain-binding protein 4 isoform X2 [Periplaneta americana]|uniref:WW domain-binding protein 4 isoform X2 n=1 Tax=Periplaneta americana TaxID=6978 RepID=UPI0037E784AA
MGRFSWADYWKSQAKKFCDFCKCWIADNKPSIEFHEKGKRHKENVAKRLSEISKKSRQEHQKSLKVDDEMKKMEEAAMKAYMKDMEENADLTSQLLKETLSEKSQKCDSDTPSSSIKTEPSTEEAAPEVPAPEVPKLWYEAKSEQGYIYFWHIETGESRWEPPEEGFMSLDEQSKEEKKKLKKEAEKERQRKEEEAKRKEETRAYIEREKMKSRRLKEEDTKPEEESLPVLGPAPRVDPYGSWKTIETRLPEPVDLQLPEQEYVPIKVPSVAEPQVKFKEKTLSGLGEDAGGAGASFKKRKLNNNPKRNMRQRLNEDY